MNESEELAFIAEDVKALAKDVFLLPHSRASSRPFGTRISSQG
jgi:hypothetical protein